MREIRFRGKRISTGDWVYGDLIQTEKNFEKRVQILDWTQIQTLVDVDPEKVGQFTGLKDKNGTEIYFDDLVKAPSGNIFRVIWYEDEMRIALSRMDTIYNFNVPLYEVAGNIYQHPDLLK